MGHRETLKASPGLARDLPRAQVLPVPYTDTHEQLPNHVRHSRMGIPLAASPPAARSHPVPRNTLASLGRSTQVNPSQPRSTLKIKTPFPQTAAAALNRSAVCPKPQRGYLSSALEPPERQGLAERCELGTTRAPVQPRHWKTLQLVSIAPADPKKSSVTAFAARKLSSIILSPFGALRTLIVVAFEQIIAADTPCSHRAKTKIFHFPRNDWPSKL
jgi:hypothetical protein